MIQAKRNIALALIAALLLITVTPVLAYDSEAQQRQLESIRQQMQNQQTRMNKAQTQVKNISEQMHLIDVDLDAAAGDLSAIQEKRLNTEQQIEADNQLLEKAEKDLAERTGILNKRMRDIYEHGQISYLDVLLGAADFGDFTTRVDILRRVLNQDAALIAGVKAERELVIQKRAELEKNRLAILELEKQVTEKKSIVEAKRAEKEAVLDSAVYERDLAEQAYQELQDTSRRIEQMIRNRESGNIDVSGSGSMIWPAQGPITSPFGWRIHPIFGTQRFHSGIDIGASYGDSIRAADSGVVIYANWMGGYGKAVIIDHGGGISTLYGHQSELLVSEGQRVVKGQVIGRVGATGYATGPHLHFEVRSNGSPVSPMNYLP